MNTRQGRRVLTIDENGKAVTLDLNGIFCGEDTVEKQYMRKIIGDIFVNELTANQQKLAALYFVGNNTSMKEAADILGVSSGSVAQGIHKIKKRVARNIERYRVECVHIIDVTDTPKIVRDVTKVYKIQCNEKEHQLKAIYLRVYNEYEETISFIKSRIKQINEQLKSLPYIARQPLELRKKILQQELSELYRSAHKVSNYID